jgi:hypothetical protein
LLDWTEKSLCFFLDRKLDALDEKYFAGGPSDPRSCETWLGRRSLGQEPGLAADGVVQYLLRHTRLIPRDVVSLGNALCVESRMVRDRGESSVSSQRLRDLVAVAARRFGNSQVAQCSNQIAADMMPDGAGLYEFSDVYTAGGYVRRIEAQLRELIQAVGAPRFRTGELSVLRELASNEWSSGTDLPSVLWQNGLLGYESPSGELTFYSLGHADEFHLPDDVPAFAFHPCLVASVGL